MKFLRCLLASMAMSLLCLSAGAQTFYVSPKTDQALAEKLLQELYGIRNGASASGVNVSTADLMTHAATKLMGTPYVAGTLDTDPVNEQLRIYLTKTDCILFVETCLDLALTVKENRACPDFVQFAWKVASTRYRCDEPWGYGDRIHYTTEWIRRQDKVLKDITLDLGGEVYDHPINFMSTHPDSYKQLGNAKNIPRAALALQKIADVEAELNRTPMTYIPKDKVEGVEDRIKTGDIICFVSSIEGLDIAHVAIAYVKDGKVGFIHASQAAGKVIMDPKTISQYVSSRSNLAGIKVVRPL